LTGLIHLSKNKEERYKKNLGAKDADVAVRLLHKTYRSHYFQQVKNIKKLVCLTCFLKEIFSLIFTAVECHPQMESLHQK